MHAKRWRPRIPLPKSWPRYVKSAVLHTISLAHYAIVRARLRAEVSTSSQELISAENERLSEECNLLREEIRIKDLRMTQIPPHKRPRYRPHERMAILKLRAARGWSIKQTADALLITEATVSSWMRCIDEIGPKALLQLSDPVNKFPDFVRYLVKRLKTLCPAMGKVRIADTLCRAGLHLGAMTVGRILKEEYEPGPDEEAQSSTRVVMAKRPGHVWHVDLTTIPSCPKIHLNPEPLEFSLKLLIRHAHHFVHQVKQIFGSHRCLLTLDPNIFMISYGEKATVYIQR